jgi:hypothetical protein
MHVYTYTHTNLQAGTQGVDEPWRQRPLGIWTRAHQCFCSRHSHTHTHSQTHTHVRSVVSFRNARARGEYVCLSLCLSMSVYE